MKKFLALLGLAVVAVNPAAHAAHSASLGQLDSAQIAMAIAAVNPLDLVNWKVGDSAEMDVKAGAFGKLGNISKSVTKEEGNAIWVKQDAKLMTQNEVMEMLISRVDGKVLKLIHNGKEEAVPEDKIEIISQDYTEVTVPAGTFKAIHIVAKTKQVDHVEVWANPRDTVMDGTLKQTMKMQGIDIVTELTSFKHAS
jgi:hypothetical protein